MSMQGVYDIGCDSSTNAMTRLGIANFEVIGVVSPPIDKTNIQATVNGTLLDVNIEATEC